MEDAFELFSQHIANIREVSPDKSITYEDLYQIIKRVNKELEQREIDFHESVKDIEML